MSATCIYLLVRRSRLMRERRRGLEADQKVVAAHGCYAMTATTALTAQNTVGVQDIHHVPPQFVRGQIDAVFSDIRPDVVKTGQSPVYPGRSGG